MTQPEPGTLGTDRSMGTNTIGVAQTAITALQKIIETFHQAADMVLQAIHDLLQRIHDYFDDHKLESWLPFWGDKLVKAAQTLADLANRIKQGVDQVFETLEKALNGAFPVLSLFTVGQDWVSKIEPPLTSMTNDFTPSDAEFENWHGEARATYETRTADQHDAVAAVGAKARMLGEWLGDVGQENVGFINALVDLVRDIAEQMTALGANVAQTAGGNATAAVPASEKASEVVATVVTSVLRTAQLMMDRLAQVANQLIHLGGEYGELSGVPGGNWPQAVNR